MILSSLLLISFCCLIIWRASDGFETASEYLGRNLSEGVRGATINAVGSSIPELFTTLFFLFVLKDKDGFAGGIGTTAGSAIFNGMIIPAFVVLMVIFKNVSSSVQVSRKVILRDGIGLLFCELMLVYIIGGDTLTWVHGVVMMSLYVVYSGYMIASMKANQSSATDEQVTHEIEEHEEEEEEGKDRGFLFNLITLNIRPLFIKSKNELNDGKAWTMLLTAMFVISSSCFMLVHSCEMLGEAMNVPIYFVAVIIASAATSVPDTILSMKDAAKGNYDDAVSNALGSNIFDVCFALGFPLFAFTLMYGPITMSPEAVENITELRILLFFFTFIAFIIFVSKKSLGIVSAILLLLIYVAFTSFILGKSANADFALAIADFLHQIDAFVDGFRFWR